MRFVDVASFLTWFESVRRRTRALGEAVPEEFLERAAVAGRFTPGDILRHVAATERWMWAENARRRPSRYPGHGRDLADGKSAVLWYLDEMHAQSVEIFESLTSEDLQRRCTTVGGVDITVWKWLRLMVEHEIHHRGQLYETLGFFGVPTPSLYGLTEAQVRERSRPAAAEPPGNHGAIMKTAEGESIETTATRLQEELKQKKPFRSAEQQALLALLRTGDACKHRFTEVFEAEGVTFQQYNVLRILRGAGTGGLPTLEIGERMIERTPGVTRIVDRLEAKGWVTRVRGKEDRRRVWCRINTKGLELLARLDDPVGRTDAAVFEGLGRGELRELIRLLDAVRTHVSKSP